MTSARHWAGSALVAGALVLSACSSSGGGSAPSQSQIESKLKRDPTITSLKATVPSSAQGKFDIVIACVAKAMQKDVKKSDLKAYLAGKKKLKDVSGNDSAGQKDVGNCVKSLTGSG